LFLAPAAAFGQAAQFGPGQIYGNSTAAQRNGRAENVTAILDRALSSVRGSIIERGASGWGVIGPGTSGLAFISGGAGADPAYGILGYPGGGCGAAISASNGGVFFSGASACSLLAGTATARLPLLSGANVVGVWGAFTLPASVTSGGVACFTSATAMSSSGGLTAGAIMLGGGSGICPGSAGLGTTTTVYHGNAGGAGAFGSVVSADLNITTTSCTNQVITAISATASGTCTSIAYAMIAASSLATAANLEAGAANVLLSAAIIYDAEQTITFNATQTFDFNTFLNGRITLTANITSLTCSNMKASQSGVITLVQDGTGSRTMVAGWCTQFRWATGVRGVLSTAASSVDALFYQCVSTSICYVSLSKAQAN